MGALEALDETGLEAAIRDLATAIDWPTAAPNGAPDVAMRVRVRLADRPARPRARWLSRPMRRAVVLALLALLALAAIAGAVGLGLPGLRISLGEPSSPPPTVDPARTTAPGAPGSRLGLGDPVSLAEARVAAPGRVLLPPDPSLGPPDAVYVDPDKADQVALVWAARPDLPELLEPGIGLILMSFDGSLEPGFSQKIIGSGSTMEAVEIGTGAGFWIEGDPHIFFYRSDDGFIDDERRWVGDALLWSEGGITYRLETSLDRDAAIALAESLE
jgi:hypothetical protein